MVAEIVAMDTDFTILRVKDRFNSESEPCGYRDLCVNVMCKGRDKGKNSPGHELEGIVCEIQFHHRVFYAAKSVSHKMYKKTRLFENAASQRNEAYEYARRHIRPVLGRFKRYPIADEERDSLDDTRTDIM